MKPTAAQAHRRVKELAPGLDPSSCWVHLGHEIVVQAGRDATDFMRFGLYDAEGNPSHWPLDCFGKPIVVAGVKDQVAHINVRHFFLHGECQVWLDLAGIPLRAHDVWSKVVELFNGART